MATDVRKLAQDAAYVSVGVGVLAFQRAQVSRREAQARLEKQLKVARDQIEGARERLTATAEQARGTVDVTAGEVKQRLSTTLDDVRSRIEPLAEQVQERLPEPLAKVVENGRTRIKALTSAA